MLLRYSILVLSTVVLVSSVAQAQIHSLSVSVDGMACPFCAYGVEKKLKKVDGVGSITIDMKKSTATLRAKNGQSINIAQIPEAVKESGFSLGKIEITAIGNIKKNGQQFVLLIPDTDFSFPLLKIKKFLKDRLASYEQTGALVEVRGVIHEDSGGTWMLSPETVEEVFR